MSAIGLHNGKPWSWHGRLVVWLVMLLLPLASFAQEHEVATGVSISYKDGGKLYGTIRYKAYLEGGTKTGDNTFDFSGQDRARLRLEIGAQPGSGKWGRRIELAILGKELNRLGAKNWTPEKRGMMLLSENLKPYYFTCDKPGTYSLSLPIAYIDKKDYDDEISIDEADWSVLDNSYRITIEQIVIIGLPTAEERNWQGIKARNLLTEIIDFATGPVSNRKLKQEADEIIWKRVDDDFRARVIHDDAKPTTRAFIEDYQVFENRGIAIIDTKLALARENLHIPPPPPPPPPDPVRDRSVDKPFDLAAKAWAAILPTRDTAQIGSYLKQYAGLIPGNDAAAADSLICWTPADYEILPERNGRKQIQLKYFHSPAYYDIYRGRLDIEDNQLATKKLLSVKVLQSGAFSLTVVDKLCPAKRKDIQLTNLMNAKLKIDSLAGRYDFTFSGGQPPYRLRLYPEGVAGQDWKRAGITLPTVSLHRDSLMDAGLEGNYRAEAFSTGSDSPVAITGALIRIPPRPMPAWILPTLIVLGIGGLALLVFFILRRGGSQQRTIFDEA